MLVLVWEQPFDTRVGLKGCGQLVIQSRLELIPAPEAFRAHNDE